jgi:PAS domain S-box-containing protein
LSILVTLFGASYALVRLQEAYRRVAQERSKVLAAIEASQNAIWVSDADHRIAMVNSAMEALIGRRREELLGQTCRHLLGMHSLDGASICDTVCPLLGSAGDSGRVEACLSPPSGKEVWSEVSYGRVIDTDGRLAGVVHIVHDLTERKEIERLKDEFISTVSHELRTPLNHIKGYATTLLQTDVEWDKATEQDFLESISGEADRLTSLVEKILHLSRLEADGLPMDREWYQVNDLVNGALQRRRGLVRDREVEMHLATSLPALFVDGREIEVVLMNLIENAAKYSDPSTPITLGTELKGDQVVFSVSDRGTGIPPDEVDKIFERFYRAEGGGRGSAGTGLGLAICKRIIKAHHGRIWVESTSGTGSCFCFSLPLDGTTNETT